jgi:hypothetical protein
LRKAEVVAVVSEAVAAVEAAVVHLRGSVSIAASVTLRVVLAVARTMV